MAKPKTQNEAAPVAQLAVAPADQQAPVANGAAAPAADASAKPAFEYAIEDGVPMPTKRAGKQAGQTAFPFAKLGVGQSFFVPATEKSKEPWKTLTSLTSRQNRDLHPKRFSTARDSKDGKEGVRIWRLTDTDQPLKPPRQKKAKASQVAEQVAGDTSKPQQAPQPEPMFS